MKKFNRNNIMELRKNLPEMLKSVPEGEKIELDKDLLDDLIFFKGKTQDGKDIKCPIWTGKFLRKIDLKDLDFKNAILYIPNWGLNKNDNRIIDIENFKYALRYELHFDDVTIEEFIEQYEPEKYIIDFSKTNIKIDFNELCSKFIGLCDFHGVDLSHSNIGDIDTQGDDFTRFINLSNTKIKQMPHHQFNEVDLSDNDFSDIVISSFNEEVIDNIWSSDFKNTGLRLEYKYKTPIINQKLKELGFYECFNCNDYNDVTPKDQNCKINDKNYYDYITEEEFRLYRAKLAIQKAYIEGRLDGCYLNGKKLNSRQLYDDTISSISEQINGLNEKPSNKNSIESDEPKIRF